MSTNPKFAKLMPNKKDICHADINNGLFLHFPLTSYTDSSTSIPKISRETLKKYSYGDFENSESVNNYKDYFTRLAVVISLWNQVKHFDVYTKNDNVDYYIGKCYPTMC